MSLRSASSFFSKRDGNKFFQQEPASGTEKETEMCVLSPQPAMGFLPVGSPKHNLDSYNNQASAKASILYNHILKAEYFFLTMPYKDTTPLPFKYVLTNFI